MSNEKKKNIRIILFVIAVTLLASTVCLAMISKATGKVLVDSDNYNYISKVAEKYGKLYAMQEKIDKSALNKPSAEFQMNSIYKGLFASLDDPYSVYMTPKEAKKWSDSVEGIFSGVGIVFSKDGAGRIIIIRILDGSPASYVGLRIGDEITKVDGRAYDDLSATANAIRGRVGTSVRITRRRGKNIKTVKVIRATLSENSVHSRLLDRKTGYIWISQFSKDTASEFRRELSEMERRGVNGLVLDLRENGGGYLDQGIDVADMLLPEGTITYIKGRNGKKKFYNSKEEATKLPYVILINGNTASAAEVVTAAVKDNKGGKIVGTKSFGKGVVQESSAFRDGSVMKLTVSEYYSPKGHKIDGNGISPDVEISMKVGEKRDRQLLKAVSLLR